MKGTLFSLAVGAALLARPTEVKEVPNVPQMAPMALNSYAKAPPDIGTAIVFDLNHDEIGTVYKVDLGPLGKPQVLEVQLSISGRIIKLMASSASYDESQKIVTVGLDRNQIAQMLQQPDR